MEWLGGWQKGQYLPQLTFRTSVQTTNFKENTVGRPINDGRSRKEYQVYWEIWLKARREGRLTVKLPSHADAVRTRFGLYNSVKAIRTGKLINEELKDAVDNCSINISDCTLTIMPTWEKVEVSALLGVLGKSMEEVGIAPPKTQEELDMEGMQARVLEKLQVPDGGGEAAPQRDRPRVDYAELARKMKEAKDGAEG